MIFRFSEVFGPLTQPSSADIYDFWCLRCYNDGHLASPRVIDYLNQRVTNKLRWRNALAESTAPVHFIHGPADPINPHPHFVNFYRWVLESIHISKLLISRNAAVWIYHYLVVCYQCQVWSRVNCVVVVVVRFCGHVLTHHTWLHKRFCFEYDIPET